MVASPADAVCDRSLGTHRFENSSSIDGSRMPSPAPGRRVAPNLEWRRGNAATIVEQESVMSLPRHARLTATLASGKLE